MTRHRTTLPPEHFAGYYAEDPDPWRFATSPYEKARYAATLASLPRPHYLSGLEIGCSIGILTRHLAGRCDAVLGLDVVPSALENARANCAGQPNARFALLAAPAEWPEGRFDLIVLSEVLYFFDRTDLARLAGRVEGALLPGGNVVLVHWLGETNFPLTGDEAAEGFIAATAGFARPVRQDRAAEYRLDVLSREG
ncbi:SAM-dependent methyltransferase [Enterovirga sp.]|uniref:class I SAM-dependent DNA methyltransferase n=1 Tax=Enterovirga sp. TaxID=2026350 RepID=UPI002B63FA96|nr:SAM-dependent methyltransferase [Enterovirga sp.]HMO29325.1 SAM-dependent methyltransferase [Enterovirga sp.]